MRLRYLPVVSVLALAALVAPPKADAQQVIDSTTALEAYETDVNEYLCWRSVLR